MSVTTKEKEYKRLRSYLNPYIRGKSVDATLNALATSSAYLVNSVQAVNDSLYVVTAQGNYLDLRLADFGITRDPTIGLSDNVFRTVGIEVKNRKQVRDLINKVLDAIFGDQFVKTTSNSQNLENDPTASPPRVGYALQDGDTLIVNFDGATTSTITFHTSQFTNIAQATAQEVANAISIGLSNLGVKGSAILNNDGNGNYVQLISNTIGASSSVTVLGGRAQNVLLFDSIVPTAGNFSTQWTITLLPGGNLKYTWSGGADPNIGSIQPLQYVNIYGGGFASSSNEGTYTIITAQGGAIGSAFFEINNPTGSTGVIVQGTDTAVQFYIPVRETLLSKSYYAAVYQTESNTLQIFMPATTQAIKRSRIGSAHLHGTDLPDSGPSTPETLGSYIYDTQQGFTIGNAATTLTAEVNGQTSRVIEVADSSAFPDSSGYLIINYGSADQEGPLPYIARPSNGTLLISPAYFMTQDHPAGSSVLLIESKSPITLPSDGSAYEPFLTDTASGRVYAQNLINEITAAGVTVIYTILYPDPIGLGGWESAIANEIEYIYGP